MHTTGQGQRDETVLEFACAVMIPKRPEERVTMATSHNELLRSVCEIVESLQLIARRKVWIGRTIWGSNRTIDVIASDPETGERLGIQCRYQGKSGTTYEKIPAQIDDMRAWPIRGVVVLAGEGFAEDFKGFLRATGHAIELDELDVWLRVFFGRDLE